MEELTRKLRYRKDYRAMRQQK